jgi:hypothetical protein
MSDVPTNGGIPPQPDTSQTQEVNNAGSHAEQWTNLREPLLERLQAAANGSEYAIRIAHVTGAESGEAHALDAAKDQADGQANSRYDIDRRLLGKAETIQRAAGQTALEADASGQKTVAFTTDSALIEGGEGEIKILGASGENWTEADIRDLLEKGYNPRGQSISGWTPRPPFEQGTARARALVAQNELSGPDGTRFKFPENPYDGKEQDPQTGELVKARGRFAASHAETQQIALHLPEAAASEAGNFSNSQEIAPVEQIYGVSRPQCIDCRAFAQAMARAYGATIIVTGPEATRIFYSDGSVGVHVNGDAQGTIYVFTPEEAWNTWQPLLDNGKWGLPSAYQRTIP